MKVRSLGLAILGAVLLIAAGVLGAILVHDGESRDLRLAQAAAGDDVALKGEPQPFYPDDLGHWSPVRPLLREHTYTIAAEEGIVALLTSDTPAPAGVVLAAGQVLFVGPYPGEAAAMLVVVHVEDWREPILFD